MKKIVILLGVSLFMLGSCCCAPKNTECATTKVTDSTAVKSGACCDDSTKTCCGDCEQSTDKKEGCSSSCSDEKKGCPKAKK